MSCMPFESFRQVSEWNENVSGVITDTLNKHPCSKNIGKHFRELIYLHKADTECDTAHAHTASEVKDTSHEFCTFTLMIDREIPCLDLLSTFKNTNMVCGYVCNRYNKKNTKTRLYISETIICEYIQCTTLLDKEMWNWETYFTAEYYSRAEDGITPTGSLTDIKKVAVT